MTAKVD